MIRVGSGDPGRRGSPACAEGPVAWGALLWRLWAHLLGGTPGSQHWGGLASHGMWADLLGIGSGTWRAEPATPSQEGPHPHPHHRLLQRTTPQQPGADRLHAWMSGRMASPARGLAGLPTARGALGGWGPGLTDLDGERRCADLAQCTARPHRACVCGRA